MPDYKTMYYSLAAQVVDTIELLIRAQQNREESVLGEASPVATLYPAKNSKDTDQKEKTES